MGLRNKYSLEDENGNEIATVIPLAENKISVAGLYPNLGIDEYIISNKRLDTIKQLHNLTIKQQTSIFDYIWNKEIDKWISLISVEELVDLDHLYTKHLLKEWWRVSEYKLDLNNYTNEPPKPITHEMFNKVIK